MTTISTRTTTALTLAGALLAMGMTLVLVPHTSAAQRAPDAAAAQHGRGRGHDARTPAERLAHWQTKLAQVSQRLQLSAAQNQQALRILRETLGRVEQMRATTPERSPERRATRHALLEEADTRFAAILTPQQRATWAVVKSEVRERRAARHHGRGRAQRSEAQRGI